ncbi:Ig-like domain-containing protein [Nostoc flagelliforme]|uniref:Ig-like domain-containing protein n=1 Tax=Nostoc flagelliforme TaxID=1306274 RepID=UPI000C2D1661
MPFNNTPIFTSGFLSENSAVVGQTYQYQFLAQDSDGDPISYNLAQNSSGAFIEKDKGLFTWTPQPSQTGSNTFIITIDDGRGGKNNLPFGRNILSATNAPPNASPVITSVPRKNIAFSQTYLYTVQASDSNYDPLSYTLETAPQGMAIDAQGRIIWQPGATQFGSNPVSIKVSDGRGGVVTQTFNIDVVSATYQVNNAPSITSTPNLVTNLERTYAYNLTGSDPDNDLLVWSLDNPPTGMVIDPQSGALRWQPQKDQIGEHRIVVRLIDAYGLSLSSKL